MKRTHSHAEKVASSLRAKRWRLSFGLVNNSTSQKFCTLRAKIFTRRKIKSKHNSRLALIALALQLVQRVTWFGHKDQTVSIHIRIVFFCLSF